MMDLWEAIKERRSIRRYVQGRDVSPETVEQLLQAAMAAPSAGNCQPWHFVVVRDAETKQGLAEAAYGQRFVAQAPVVIVVCADPARSAARYGRRGSELYCLQDERAAATVLNLPSDLRPVAMIPIGHPGERFARRTSRRPLSEMTTFIE
jgi:nitroreductase